MLAELVRQSSGGTEMYRTRQPRPPRSVDLVARLGRQVQKFLWPPDAQRASSSSPEEAQPPREVQQGQETAEPTSRHMGKGPVTAVQPAVSGNHDACRASAPLLSSPLYFTSLLPMRGPAMRCFPRRMRSPLGSTGSGWPGRRGPLV
jgi:hypothetical protein